MDIQIPIQIPDNLDSIGKENRPCLWKKHDGQDWFMAHGPSATDEGETMFGTKDKVLAKLNARAMENTQWVDQGCSIQLRRSLPKNPQIGETLSFSNDEEQPMLADGWKKITRKGFYDSKKNKYIRPPTTYKYVGVKKLAELRAGNLKRRVWWSFLQFVADTVSYSTGVHIKGCCATVGTRARWLGLKTSMRSSTAEQEDWVRTLKKIGWNPQVAAVVANNYLSPSQYQEGMTQEEADKLRIEIFIGLCKKFRLKIDRIPMKIGRMVSTSSSISIEKCRHINTLLGYKTELATQKEER